MKVLIVDDARTYQAMLASYIAEMGFESVAAMNGEEALDIFPQEWPDLILMDVNMPGINGYETARQIRDLGEEWAHWVPIIFLSSSVEDKDIVMGIEAGGDDYLAKPISEIVLHAKIKAMMRMADHRRNTIEVAEALSKANEELEHQSKTDGLTGIANKRHFNDYLKQEWFRAMRSETSISLLFVDVDLFKPYNDNYGHLKGDRCLKKIAQTLHGAVQRSVDLVCRYGGEEFAVILPDTDHAGMCHIGEVMVKAMRAVKLPHAYSSVGDIVTVSVGGATMTPSKGESPDLIIQQSDQGLYQAKGSGRNRFVAY